MSGLKVPKCRVLQRFNVIFFTVIQYQVLKCLVSGLTVIQCHFFTLIQCQVLQSFNIRSYSDLMLVLTVFIRDI